MNAPACDRVGCSSTLPALWHPLLQIPALAPYEAMRPIQVVLPELCLCDECHEKITVDEVLDDERWAVIVKHFMAGTNGVGPDRGRTRLGWVMGEPPPMARVPGHLAC